MFAFIVQRLFQAVLVMLVVGLISFALFRFTGDPVNNMLGQEATIEQRQALREKLGLNDPVPMQFFKFLVNASQGEFGLSYRVGKPVEELIATALPATLELVFVSALMALLIGVPMGVYTGLKRHAPLSRMFLTVSLVGVSLPTFVIGILMILVFGVWLGWLPTFGRQGLVDLGFWETGLLTLKGWSFLIMPAFTLALFQLTLIMRLVRAEMLEVLRTDYIKFAKARGLRNRAINYGHALKNTLVPVITIMGLQVGSLLAFSIITETVFAWPGMGRLFLDSIRFVDIPIMSCYLMLMAFFFVIINLSVDLLYYAVDPRLRAETLGGAAH
ncbi:peptide/nickel transport system permease protein [Tistlia consotensis]|uniref:Peptide/nickel transport system permease protein n=1 Tax=Tistlia consotensis USBA 355 TaxID=560819 RepID=A0A1Y6B487_9PROT|nr:ABC transporter permease [Tistlia consotensis]SME88597.1 peptide/nickel transport system permease protein [Tistlia consotensis USBA 355]SNR25105.1 peptide/nickel transport system permease protein [Tistlia consotensis]